MAVGGIDGSESTRARERYDKPDATNEPDQGNAVQTDQDVQEAQPTGEAAQQRQLDRADEANQAAGDDWAALSGVGSSSLPPSLEEMAAQEAKDGAQQDADRQDQAKQISVRDLLRDSAITNGVRG